MKQRLMILAACMLLLILSVESFGYWQEGTDPPSRDQVPSRLIVKFHDDVDVNISSGKAGTVTTSLSELNSINEKYGVTKQLRIAPLQIVESRQHPLHNTYVISFDAKADIFEANEEYSRLESVKYAEPDYPLTLYSTPGDSLYTHQWGLNNTGQDFYFVDRISGSGNDTLGLMHGISDADMDFQEVFDNPPDDTKTVVVAIIDTGLDMDHPDMIGKVWTNSDEIADNGIDDDHNGYIDDVHGWDFAGDYSDSWIDPDNDPTDEYGHGTHCAGIVTAVTDNDLGVAGLAPDCRIMPLDFDPYAFLSVVLSAVTYAADNGADVISMSFGMRWYSQMMDDALTYARSKGVVLCASAGNDGREYYNYPASYTGVITVSATDCMDSLASFSTYGDSVDVGAPGLHIMSLRADTTDMYAEGDEPDVHIIDGHYYLASGTSMSCPAVAGVVAYLRSVSPGLSPDAVETILENAADDIMDSGWDIYTGSGRVNLYESLELAPSIRAEIASPSYDNIISGSVSVTGTADGNAFQNYVLEYGEGNLPDSWTTITSSGTSVTDGTLASWNTTGLAGEYTIRLRVGSDNFDMVTVYVANGSIAEFDTPAEDDTLSSWKPIIGTATSPDFGYYTIDCWSNLDSSTVYEVNSSCVPVGDDTLGILDSESIISMADLGDGGFVTLRLRVYSFGDTLLASDEIEIFMESIYAGVGSWKVDLDSCLSNTANYGDFDQDGTNEIVVGTDKGLLFFDLYGNQKTAGMPSPPAYDFRISPAVGDIDGDGYDDLVTIGVPSGGGAELYAYLSTDTSYVISAPTDPYYRSTADYDIIPLVWLRDVDGDWKDEIIYYPGGYYHEYHILRNGSWESIDLPGVTEGCFLSADLDADGTDEFYIESNGVLYLTNQSGAIIDSYDMKQGVYSSYINMDLSAYDIDGDCVSELIAFGYPHDGYPDFQVFAFDCEDSLSLIDGWPHDTGVNSFNLLTPPAFADLNRDGEVEYTMACNTLDGGYVYVRDLDGNDFGSESVFATWDEPCFFGHPMIADLNGDRDPDIMVGVTPDVYVENIQHSLLAFDNDGQMLSGKWPYRIETEMYSFWNRMWRMPMVCDPEEDGYADVVLTTVNAGLVKIRMDDDGFHHSAAPVPMWRYNRRLNNIGIPAPANWVCGDADGSGVVDYYDIDFLIEYIYYAGPPPCPEIAADANGDCTINLSDILLLISYLYQSGPAPTCDCRGEIMAGGRQLYQMAKTMAVGQAFIEITYDSENSNITLESSHNIAALELVFDRTESGSMKCLIDSMEIIRSRRETEHEKILLIDRQGNVTLGTSGQIICEIPGEIDLISAVAVDLNGDVIDVVTEPMKKAETLPVQFSLAQNYPNPFNPQTEIAFSIPHTSRVSISVINVLGRHVSSLIDRQIEAGIHTVMWDGTDESGNRVASGVYFYRIEAGDYVESRKMVLLK